MPGSRLLLKNKPFACEVVRRQWLCQLEALGVEAWRVDLLPLAPANADHMAMYAQMDISLDPWPYAGGSLLGHRANTGSLLGHWVFTG